MASYRRRLEKALKKLAAAGVPDHVRPDMVADPCIAAALTEGFTLKNCANPTAISQLTSSKIGIAGYRYGGGSPQAQAAIDEHNRINRMMMSARAAYNRIMLAAGCLRYVDEMPVAIPRVPAAGLETSLTPGEDARENGAPAAADPVFRPVWSKKPRAKYRELQNIPAAWKVDKVVLMNLGPGHPVLRIFASSASAGRAAAEQLAGSPVVLSDLKRNRHDYDLTPAQYERAASGDVQ